MECSICCTRPGNYARIRFLPEEKSVEVRMCAECRSEFRAQEDIALEVVDDPIA